MHKLRLLGFLILLLVLQPAVNALTLNEFVGLKKEEQILYLYGVMDVAIIEATPAGRNTCAEKWGVVNAYNHLVGWYNRDSNNPANTNINVALLVNLQIDEVCSKEVDARKKKQ